MADSIVNPAGMSADTFLTVGICLVVATSLVVSARLWVNWRYVRRKVLLDDVAAVISPIFISATLALTYVSVKGITQGNVDIRVLTQLGAAVSTIAAFAMWTAKAPILFFLLHNFQIKRWLRNMVITTLSVSAMCFLIGSSITAYNCTPHDAQITPSFLAKCSEDSSTMGVFLGIVAVVMDLAILILPLPIILRLQLPLQKRISLALLFLSGILEVQSNSAIAASAVSLAYKWLSRSGASTDMTAAMICTIIECCIALMIGCAPAMYSFWTKFCPEALNWSRGRGGSPRPKGANAASSSSTTTASARRLLTDHSRSGGAGSMADSIYLSERN
ncbi:hypothetical protein BDV12DRAFT_203788 [Aspergillus spectabilis]